VTVFWLAVAVLLVLAAFFVMQPFLFSANKLRAEQKAVAIRQRQNVQIYEERLRELDRDHEAGNLDDEDYKAGKAELELELLADAQPEPEESSIGPAIHDKGYKTHILSGVILSLAVIAVTATSYYYRGNYEPARQLTAMHFSDGELASATEAAQRGDMSQLLDQLYRKLQQAPDNLEGWMLLSRTAMNTENYGLAVEGFNRVIAILESQNSSGDQDLAPFYGLLAQAHYFNSKGVMTTDARLSLDAALQRNPDEVNALGLKAISAFDQQNYPEAIENWQHILRASPEHPSRESIQAAVVRAQQLSGAQPGALVASNDGSPGAEVPQTNSNRAARIPVRVELSPELANQVSQDDVVFIIARDPSGPPMPLAVSRHRVSDLPVEVVLDDGMAMAPMARLSNVDAVTVSARVSKSGQPIAQPGDLQGAREGVGVRTNEAINIQINTVL